jgi:hypothetical protein
MASRFAKQNADLVVSTLKKHSTFMRLKLCGHTPHVNNLAIALDPPLVEHENLTRNVGHVVLFNEDGLVCHLQDDSALYEYDVSDNEFICSEPFVAPIVHITDMDSNYVPDLDGYLVAHMGEEKYYIMF